MPKTFFNSAPNCNIESDPDSQNRQSHFVLCSLEEEEETNFEVPWMVFIKVSLASPPFYCPNFVSFLCAVFLSDKEPLDCRHKKGRRAKNNNNILLHGHNLFQWERKLRLGRGRERYWTSSFLSRYVSCCIVSSVRSIWMKMGWNIFCETAVLQLHNVFIVHNELLCWFGLKINLANSNAFCAEWCSAQSRQVPNLDKTKWIYQIKQAWN